LKFTLVLLLLVSLLEARITKNPQNFSQAKNLARVIYLDDKVSYYNNCRYYYDKTSCLSKTLIESCSDATALHVEFRRLIPASFFAKDRVCMTQKICTSMRGVTYSGERCCRKTDKAYQVMESDVFNIIPVINTYIDEIPKDRRGDVARVYLYYNSKYGVQLSEEEHFKYYRWHTSDKPDKRECSIYKSTKKLQKHENIWLEKGCRDF